MDNNASASCINIYIYVYMKALSIGNVLFFLHALLLGIHRKHHTKYRINKIYRDYLCYY